MVPDWFALANQCRGLIVARRPRGTGILALVVVMVDAPAGKNQAYYRIGPGISRLRSGDTADGPPGSRFRLVLLGQQGVAVAVTPSGDGQAGAISPSSPSTTPAGFNRGVLPPSAGRRRRGRQVATGQVGKDVPLVLLETHLSGSPPPIWGGGIDLVVFQMTCGWV